jgi:hypothetical protein
VIAAGATRFVQKAVSKKLDMAWTTQQKNHSTCLASSEFKIITEHGLAIAIVVFLDAVQYLSV